MSARTVLAKASASGVHISAMDGNLSLRGDEHAIAKILPEVRAYKPEILIILAANDPALPQELDELLSLVAKAQGFTLEETKEVREIASGDVPNALTCFRLLAERASGKPQTPASDDRVFCSDCQNLVRGRCQLAARGLMANTYQGYSPVPDVLRRCEHFQSRLH